MALILRQLLTRPAVSRACPAAAWDRWRASVHRIEGKSQAASIKPRKCYCSNAESLRQGSKVGFKRQGYGCSDKPENSAAEGRNLESPAGLVETWLSSSSVDKFRAQCPACCTCSSRGLAGGGGARTSCCAVGMCAHKRWVSIIQGLLFTAGIYVVWYAEMMDRYRIHPCRLQHSHQRWRRAGPCAVQVAATLGLAQSVTRKCWIIRDVSVTLRLGAAAPSTTL